jgi:hypothetical protein
VSTIARSVHCTFVLYFRFSLLYLDYSLGHARVSGFWNGEVRYLVSVSLKELRKYTKSLIVTVSGLRIPGYFKGYVSISDSCTLHVIFSRKNK